MAIVTHVRLFRNDVEELLRGRNGPVVLHQANLGRQAAAIARRLAPRGKGPGPHLADSISSKLVPSSRGYDVEITAAVPHAMYVHRGTPPHTIGESVNIPGVGWRFIGLSKNNRGRIHPGTKANKFMLRALDQLGLRAREV